MSKIDTYQLRKFIAQEEFDYPLLTSALSPYSAVRQKINELLKAEVIVRVKKGLYVFGPKYNEKPICLEVLANLIYGPSCISLEYALSYHGLIPERVDTITSVTPKRDKEFATPVGRFTYRYLTTDKYSHGITLVEIDSRHSVFMASAEKALCDYLTLNKIPDIKKTSSVEEFLQSDLRIERENWSKLNALALQHLNKYYRNRNVGYIQEQL